LEKEEVCKRRTKLYRVFSACKYPTALLIAVNPLLIIQIKKSDPWLQTAFQY
jgi:hypothetical protein